MKKHISLVIVFSILLLALTNISPLVRAKQDIQETEYLAIDIYGNEIPNSKYENGLYEKGFLISPYDFIFEDLSEEQKENAFLTYSGFDDYMYLSYNFGTAEEIEIAKRNFILRTGMSEDGTYHFPFFYITSIQDFESYLIDSGYIREGESWKDIDVSEFGSRLEILQRLEEKKLGYLISKNNIPGYLFREYLLSSTENILNIDYIYEIDLGYELYIINQKISHSISVDSSQIVANEECKIKDIPNSLGKITAISINKFRYTYSLIKYDETLGYYIVSQELSNSIDFYIDYCPSFIFDSAGNLRDNYVSVRDGRWYEPKVNDIFKKINIKYWLEREYYYPVVGLEIQPFYICVAYFNFSFSNGEEFHPDTIEKIIIKYTLYNMHPINDFLHWFGKDYESRSYTCTLTKNDKVTNPDELVQWWIRDKYSTDLDKENLNSIQKGEWKREYDNKIWNFDFKFYLTNDIDGSYSVLQYWEPRQNLQIMEINVSYKSIIYDLKNISVIPILPDEDPNENPTLWDKILNFLKDVWNWEYPTGRIIIITILSILLALIVYLLWPIILPLLKFILGFIINIFEIIFSFIKKFFKKRKKE